MEKNSYPGKFIVFEGLDGSGQTTQAEILGAFLTQEGYKVLNTKEPTKESEAGKLIRKIINSDQKIDALKLQEMFSQDRRWHLENKIIPGLKEGKIVISDRYFFSSFSYGLADGLDIKEIYRLNNDFLLPDIVFFLDVGPKICLERIKKRGGKSDLFEKREVLEKVYGNYKIVLKDFRERTIICFTDSQKPIKEVFEEIRNFLRKNLGIGKK